MRRLKFWCKAVYNEFMVPSICSLLVSTHVHYAGDAVHFCIFSPSFKKNSKSEGFDPKFCGSRYTGKASWVWCLMDTYSQVLNKKMFKVYLKKSKKTKIVKNRKWNWSESCSSFIIRWYTYEHKIHFLMKMLKIIESIENNLKQSQMKTRYNCKSAKNQRWQKSHLYQWVIIGNSLSNSFMKQLRCIKDNPHNSF